MTEQVRQVRLRKKHQESTAKPAWQTLKTKELCYKEGYANGYAQACKVVEEEYQLKTNSLREQSMRLDVLKNISQAGSCILECMTKAVMSFDKTL